jgi:hypothetical protein
MLAQIVVNRGKYLSTPSMLTTRNVLIILCSLWTILVMFRVNYFYPAEFWRTIFEKKNEIRDSFLRKKTCKIGVCEKFQP